MAQEITDVSDIEVGDIISKGMQEWEVVEITERSFGQPWEATVVPQKDLDEFTGERHKKGKGDLAGYEIVE